MEHQTANNLLDMITKILIFLIFSFNLSIFAQENNNSNSYQNRTGINQNRSEIDVKLILHRANVDPGSTTGRSGIFPPTVAEAR